MTYLLTLPFGLILALIPMLLILWVPRSWFAVAALLALLPLGGLALLYHLSPTPCSSDGCIGVALIQGTLADATLLCLLAALGRWRVLAGGSSTEPPEA